jgi:hypothetical protein
MMTPEEQTIVIAKAIYWSPYDGYLREDFRHPMGFDRETAWKSASEQQRKFCLHQAFCAMQAVEMIRNTSDRSDK